MGSQERKELDRRRTIENAYVHPPADIRATRLSFVGAGVAQARPARLARLVGFEVELYGLIGTTPPSWHKRDPEDALLSYWGSWGTVITLRGYRPRAGSLKLGLQAFTMQWHPTGSPKVWLKFASWPIRASSATELVAILSDEVARLSPRDDGVH